MSCVIYFLVFKPSVMDGHRWFRRGNVWEGLKNVSYIEGYSTEYIKDFTNAVTIWFFGQFPFEERAPC